jgi:hypothetical protein
MGPTEKTSYERKRVLTILKQLPSLSTAIGPEQIAVIVGSSGFGPSPCIHSAQASVLNTGAEP